MSRLIKRFSIVWYSWAEALMITEFVASSAVIAMSSAFPERASFGAGAASGRALAAGDHAADGIDQIGGVGVSCVVDVQSLVAGLQRRVEAFRQFPRTSDLQRRSHYYDRVRAFVGDDLQRRSPRHRRSLVFRGETRRAIVFQDFGDLPGRRVRGRVAEAYDVGALFVARNVERIYDVGDAGQIRRGVADDQGVRRGVRNDGAFFRDHGGQDAGDFFDVHVIQRQKARGETRSASLEDHFAARGARVL
jgi:hypothetical protein